MKYSLSVAHSALKLRRQGKKLREIVTALGLIDTYEAQAQIKRAEKFELKMKEWQSMEEAE